MWNQWRALSLSRTLLKADSVKTIKRLHKKWESMLLGYLLRIIKKEYQLKQYKIRVPTILSMVLFYLYVVNRIEMFVNAFEK